MRRVGSQTPLGGGTAVGTIAAAGPSPLLGGDILVSSGGTELGATVFTGGLFGVFADGVASNTEVLSGGLIGAFKNFFGSGAPGLLVSTTVQAGGLVGLLGGEADNTDLKGAALANIGGITSGTILEPGAVEAVDNSYESGLDQGALVNVGSAVGTVLQSGAYLAPLSGTSVVGTVPDGGTVVSSAGVIIDRPLSGVEYFPLSAVDPDLGGFVIGDVASGALLSGGTLDGSVGVVQPGGSSGSYPSYINVQAGGRAVGLTVLNGLLVVNGSAAGVTVGSGGTDAVNSGGVDSGAVLGSGAIAVVAGGGTQDVASVASGGLVEIGTGAVVSGAAVQLGALLNFDGAPSQASASLDPATDILTVSGTDSSGNPYAQSITLAGNYAGDVFQGVSRPDLALTGLLLQVESAPCYLRGTRIAVEDGETPVECLREGQCVRTLSGILRPVRWIGTRAYDNRFVRDNPAVMPIAFAAGSLGDGLPRRKLLVSPEHAMFLDGVLVPAKLLVNDDLVVQASGLPTIEYFHVELDSHDILLAEGAPSESFVDCDSRTLFQNAHTFKGEAPRWSFCAPRIEDGPVLARIRDRLRPRAADAEAASAHGHLDSATHDSCTGWAWLPGDPQATVEVELLVDGGVIGRATANAWRADVQAAGYGTGRYGFRFAFTPPLARLRGHSITARVAGGADLHGSITLEAASSLDSDSLPALAAALQARAASPDGTEEVAAFLLDQYRATRAVRRRRSTAPLALVLDMSVPTPLRDAGSAALTSHMLSLRRGGYDVVFVPLDGVAGVLPPGIACAAPPAFTNVEDALRHHGDAALVYVHRAVGMTRYGGLVRACCPGTRLLYSVADLHFLRLGRQAVVEQRAGLLAESRRMREDELAAVRRADVTLTHSEAEARLLRGLVPGAAVRVVPWHVPAGPAPFSWRRRSGLVFVGGMAHAPNADALRWLASQVMPRLVKMRPRARCRVVGAGLTDADRAWLHPAMDVLGPLDDLSRVYRSARAAVAPLRFGAGVKGKVLDAFAAGLPCVMTPIAVEGWQLPEALHPLIAADADAFAQTAAAMLADEAANAAAGEAGRAFVVGATSEQGVDAALAHAVASARAPVRCGVPATGARQGRSEAGLVGVAGH